MSEQSINESVVDNAAVALLAPCLVQICLKILESVQSL